MLLFSTEDENEEVLNSNTNSENSFPDNTVQTARSVKSKNGWLWVGGVQGSSDDPYQAMDEAMSILKCRYAVVQTFCFFISY